MERRYKLMSSSACATWPATTHKIAEAEKAREEHPEPVQPDAGCARAAGKAADHRHHHRRAGRPDDGGRQEGRGTDRPHRAEGACRRHPPDPGDAAAVGRRDYRPDQGQHPDPDRVPGVEQDRLAHDPRPDGRRSAARHGRHAVHAAGHRLAGAGARRLCVRRRSAPRRRTPEIARRTELHRRHP